MRILNLSFFMYLWTNGGARHSATTFSTAPEGRGALWDTVTYSIRGNRNTLELEENG
jgi:hypothetical protein